MQPKITVFICTYNRAELLKESIRSVLNQTYSDIKIVVLDNASEDNTSEVVASFTDPRLSYVRHKEIIQNFNYALDHVDTEYLVIFHDDDRMFPWMIEEELKAMEANPDAGLVASSALHVLDNNKKPVRPKRITTDKLSRLELFERYAQTWKNTVICPSVMYRKSLIDLYKLRFNPEVGPAGDICFWLEANTHPMSICLMDAPLLETRVHALQDSSRQTLEMWNDTHKKLENYLIALDTCYDMKKLHSYFVNAGVVFSSNELKNKQNVDDIIAIRRSMEDRYNWFVSDEEFNDMLASQAFKHFVKIAINGKISLKTIKDIINKEAELRKIGIKLPLKRKIRWAMRYIALKMNINSNMVS